jgi:hypothetical protein
MGILHKREYKKDKSLCILTIDKPRKIWYNIDTKEREVHSMTTLDKAIEMFGFENSITITIAVLEEQGHYKLAEDLWETLTEEEEGEE